MSRRHDPPPYWVSEVGSSITVREMPDGMLEELQTFVSSIINRGLGTGTIKHAVEGRGYDGAKPRIEHRLAKAIHPCGRAVCEMELSLVDVAFGSSHVGSLDISCPNTRFGTEEEADEADAQCGEAQGTTLQSFPDWLSAQNAAVNTEVNRIADANATIANAELKLGALL